MTEVWSERAEAYRQSAAHREGPDLDRLVAWALEAGGRDALDVATGGKHTARRLEEAGFRVVTSDPAPGMQPDVICRAEDLPFVDGSFDVVACRVAPHHFEDVAAAVAELARVSRELVLVVDNELLDEAAEEGERLRDPTHVRNYSEPEWRALFEQAGLEVEEVARWTTPIELQPWLERAGCAGDEADRVRALMRDHIDPEDGTVALVRLGIKGRKRS